MTACYEMAYYVPAKLHVRRGQQLIVCERNEAEETFCALKSAAIASASDVLQLPQSNFNDYIKESEPGVFAARINDWVYRP